MIAILSNMNTDYVLRLVAKETETLPAQGYGDIWGKMLDPNSDFLKKDPETVFLIVDIEELLKDCDSAQKATAEIDLWFDTLCTVLKPARNYFVSDVCFRSAQLSDNDSFAAEQIESYWIAKLSAMMKKHGNVHVLKLNPLIGQCGKDVFFSEKLMYMGKVPYSNEGNRLIAEEILRVLTLLTRTPKKVLVLDLDNTLWGGVLGECGVDGIELSDDHMGAVYRDVQRRLLRFKQNGTLLAIASKNNLSDVEEVWEKHPHMLLKKEDFVSLRINWEDKADNLQSMAAELNLGLDSFVFLDDMPAERDNIISRLPEVTVPGFPDRLEAYPAFMDQLYADYFQPLKLTQEDQKKTQQYEENAKRAQAAQNLTYEEFLKSLHLEAFRVELNDQRLDRVAQLIGKTNQFNLTTRRYSRSELEEMLQTHYELYAYQVKDKFGDYGLVAVAIVDLDIPEIDSFLMSCRVMGREIERFVLDDIEKDLLSRGYSCLKARFIRTKKNIPVVDLYEKLGYEVVTETEEEKTYRMDLTNRPRRELLVNL
ncbi:MAG: HAD-IIIC family phosphatase [Lachnospiraceae bacterium]|nr:HAD-IIIC family phosphatase [Lachnospiraceae bacterium]